MNAFERDCKSRTWNKYMEHKHEARIWDKTVQHGGRAKRIKKRVEKPKYIASPCKNAQKAQMNIVINT